MNILEFIENNPTSSAVFFVGSLTFIHAMFRELLDFLRD